MGNIHTPRPIYKNGISLDYYVKGKTVFYRVSKWDKEGVNQSVIETAKLEDKNPDDIMNEALRLFGDVRQ